MNAIILVASLWTSFASPSSESRPWTYWLWFNGDADKTDITLDLEAMKRLGFGGVLFFDHRGYFDGPSHLVHPPAESDFMSEDWQDKVSFAIREAGRLGLKFMLNASSSGGGLAGPWKVGGDAPKMLVYRYYEPGEAFEKPDLPYFEDVWSEEVWYTGAAVKTGRWFNGGEGYVSHLTTDGAGNGQLVANPESRPRAPKGAPGARKVLVRYGMTVMPGHERDVDILDAKAVKAHYDRFLGVFKRRVPGVFGRDRTVSAIYTPSWEGSMPSWSRNFFADFRKYKSYDLREHLALLCGFSAGNAGTVLDDYREAKIKMFRDNYYGTLRDCAHADGMDISGESGPMSRYPTTFKLSDMLEMLAVEDIPQGEFWVYDIPWRNRGWMPHANANAWMHVKGAANAAHVYGRRIAAAEAFTLMNRHWATQPATLKPLADMAFADGINRMVYHTFTHSPRKYGVPGSEYFAGTHIGRNTTWHREADAFVRYLWRIQSVLQQGEPVTDIAVLSGRFSYTGNFSRERYLLETTDPKSEPQSYAKIPEGFSYDLVNDDVLGKNPGILKNYRIAYDIRKPENRGKVVPVGAEKPDVEGLDGWTFCHRCIDGADVYFLAGEGRRELTFRAASDVVETWDPVTVSRWAVPAERKADGRTKVTLELPVAGSCFVVFGRSDGQVKARNPADVVVAVDGPWTISFAHPEGIGGEPPQPIRTDKLFDFIDREETKFFTGTATYRTEIDLSGVGKAAQAAPIRLSLGSVPTGLAHAFVNGVDCGTVWCSPWEADVTKAVREGKNQIEIRYINNWNNMLIGDCNRKRDGKPMLTKSILQYYPNGRPKDRKLYSGFESGDPLQESGVVGPVTVRGAFDSATVLKQGARAMNRKFGTCRWGEPGGVRLLFLGNSITYHLPDPVIGWTNTCGMSASSAEKDYTHLVAAGLSAHLRQPVEAVATSETVGFERDGYLTWDVERELKKFIDFKPDYVVIALGENGADRIPGEERRRKYREGLAKMSAVFKAGRDRPPRVVFRGAFWTKSAEGKDPEIRAAAAAGGDPFVETCDLFADAGMCAYERFRNYSVGAHPGDKGMAEIARRILETLK